MPVDKFGRMSDTKTKDTGVSLTYINNNYIRSDGTTPVSGSIDMRGNTLYNVPDPVNPKDVATKKYADRSKHIIAVYASYHGDLIKGDYQFTFGGSSINTYKKHNVHNGFLVPTRGRIKSFSWGASGFQFSSNRYSNITDFEKSLEGVRIPIFTLIKIDKYNMNIIELATLSIKF